MSLQLAGKLAATGVFLRALHYWITNVVPSWSASGTLYRLQLADLAIVNPLIWSVYLLTRRREAGIAAALLTIVELAYAVYQQYAVLSPQSIETITFVLGMVLPSLCWVLYLLGRRVGLWYLLFTSLLQTAYAVYQAASIAGLIRSYWREDPWPLIAVPLMWIFYWASQTLFVRAAIKTPAQDQR